MPELIGDKSDFISMIEQEGMGEHLSSLRYAGIIQKALMPGNSYLKSIFRDFFVLYLPRDIVSGDFYYVHSDRHQIYIAAGDCTGHGVPGALLSILGISFLNEILQCKSDHKANRVLNQMRERVMKALRQTGEKSETLDSMDLGLCIYDRTSGKLQFSGANRPLFMVRNREVNEFKPDKMTIGVAPLFEKPFNNFQIDTQAGDCFYMFSDGYPDQFGGTDDKKFLQKNLKDVIGYVSGLQMSKQKEVLESKFMEWKGSTLQVDDVMIFGFQF